MLILKKQLGANQELKLNKSSISNHENIIVADRRGRSIAQVNTPEAVD